MADLDLSTLFLQKDRLASSKAVGKVGALAGVAPISAQQSSDQSFASMLMDDQRSPAPSSDTSRRAVTDRASQETLSTLPTNRSNRNTRSTEQQEPRQEPKALNESVSRRQGSYDSDSDSSQTVRSPQGQRTRDSLPAVSDAVSDISSASGDSVPADSASASIAELSKISVQTPKPSPVEAEKLRMLMAANGKAFERSPVLALLTGHVEQLEPAEIPQLVTSNSFLRVALDSSEPSAFMDQPFELVQILEGIEVDDDVFEGAQAVGMDLNHLWTPRQFVDAIGLDSQRVQAELKHLSSNLQLQEGLSLYMLRAARLRGIELPESMQQEDPLVSMSQQWDERRHMEVEERARMSPGKQDFMATPPGQSPSVQLAAQETAAPSAITSSSPAPSSSSTPPVMNASMAGAVDVAVVDSGDIDEWEYALPFRADHNTDVASAPIAAHSGKVQTVSDTELPYVFNPGFSSESAGELSTAETDAHHQGALRVARLNQDPYLELSQRGDFGDRKSSALIDLLNQNLQNHQRVQGDNDVSAFTLQEDGEQNLQLGTTGELLGNYLNLGMGKEALPAHQGEARLEASALGETLMAAQLSEGSSQSGADPGQGQSQSRHQQDAQVITMNVPIQNSAATARSNEAVFSLGATEHVPSQQAIRQIVSQAQMLAHQGGGSIKIDLGDESTGRIELALRVIGDQIDVKILAQNDSIREALQMSPGRLKEALGEQQLNLQSFDVGREQNSHHHGQSFAHSQRQHPGNSQSEGEGSSDWGQVIPMKAPYARQSSAARIPNIHQGRIQIAV